MIVIYGKDNCPFCVKAKALAENRGFKYSYITIGRDMDTTEFTNMFPNARTVPQICNMTDNGSEYIGGFTEFESWALSKALGGMTL